MIEGLLRGQGFPTAFYSSPHLKHFGERYRFDGVPWTFEEFEASLERLVEGISSEHRQVLEEPHRFRTAFEFLTLLALVEFRERGRRLMQADSSRPGQVVVWETGLGGRLDCTNVVDPLVSVITALGLDHTAVLGKEIEQIAAEKAGIIKPGRPVIVSRQYPEFLDRVWPVLTRRLPRSARRSYPPGNTAPSSTPARCSAASWSACVCRTARRTRSICRSTASSSAITSKRRRPRPGTSSRSRFANRKPRSWPAWKRSAGPAGSKST